MSVGKAPRVSSELPPEADSEEDKLQGTNAGGQVTAACVDAAAAMPNTNWERQLWWGVSPMSGPPQP